jgi:hypothetical protein
MIPAILKSFFEQWIMPARRFPPPLVGRGTDRLFCCRDHSGQLTGVGSRFVYLRRLFANIRRLAEQSIFCF